jgi:hypothetical protein
MPLGAFRQSLNLANPAGAPAVDYGTYQGYFRSSSSTVLTAYNTSNASQASVTHGCGTVQYVRARRIPGTTSHIVGIAGGSASKFYRYTPGTGFVQLANLTAVGRTCDIAFDTVNNKIYMANSRTATPFVALWEANLSASVTTATQLGNPAVIPTAAVQSLRFSPDGLVLATINAGATTPLMRVYTRSGSTFTSVTAPTNIDTPTTGGGQYTLSWNADSTALAYGNSTDGGVRITKWTGSSFGSTVAASLGTGKDLASTAFNPNPSYSNIILVSEEADEQSAAYYYNFNANTIATTSLSSGGTYSMENAQWSPDGLKVFLQGSSTGGRIFDLVTSYTTTTAIATLLGTGTALTTSSRGFDWMYH